MNSFNKKQQFKNDFLQGKLTPFFNYNFPDFPWEKSIKQRQNFKPEYRQLLQNILTRQHKELPNFHLIENSLKKISQPNTFFITTGQQPGLFLGPLYTFYKALDTIYFTRILQKKFPQYNFLPLFWTASEDHDYQEINHCYLTPAQKLLYPGNFHNNIVGEHLITREIKNFPRVFPEIQKHWTPGKKWSPAFRQSLAELLTSEGLIILDPNVKELKELAMPYFRKALHKKLFYNAVKEQTENLLQQGYRQQLHLSEIPFFLITSQGRIRLKERNLDKLAPEQISPDASFRPVFQEIVLPNLAYIGGWGELAYWAQLKKGFEVLDVPFPLVLPRSSYVLLPQQISLPDGFAPQDLLQAIPEIRKKFARPFLPENLEQILRENCKPPLPENPPPGYEAITQSFLRKYQKLQSNYLKKLRRHITRVRSKEWQKILDARFLIYPEKQERIWSLLTVKHTGINTSKLTEKLLASYEPRGKVLKI